MKTLLLPATASIALILTASVCSFGGPYIPHVLISPVDSYACAHDINDSGQIVGGISGATVYHPQAVLWTSYSSDPQSLDGANRSTHAQLINNSGLVIGTRESPTGISTPFKWSAGVATDIDVPFTPEAVNGIGIMVGSASGADGVDVPVAATVTGQVTYLQGVLGGGGRAVDINSLGYIAGTSSYADRWGGHATLWRVGEAAIDLGTFGGTWSHAIGVNDSGQVLGYYGDDSHGIGDFIWSMTAGTIFIPSSPLFDGGGFGGRAINDNGVVLGSASINGVSNIVTWSAEGGFTVVGPGIPYAINNSGWIVGINDYNNSQALVWEPVPEPSGLSALSAVVGCLAMAARRRRP